MSPSAANLVSLVPDSIGRRIVTDSGVWGYVNGQTGKCPDKGVFISEETASQSESAIQNLQAIAEANGFSLKDTVKTTVFLRDMSDFATVSEVHSRYFEGEHLLRTQVADQHRLPTGAKFEIDAVFYKE